MGPEGLISEKASLRRMIPFQKDFSTNLWEKMEKRSEEKNFRECFRITMP
jgi:hypothetical protein